MHKNVVMKYHIRSQSKRLLTGNRTRIKFRSRCQLKKWMQSFLVSLTCKDFSEPEIHLNNTWSILINS